MTIQDKLDELQRLCEAATPGWRAGRPDMQSYTGNTGIPFKSLYNDRIENESSEDKSLLEAGRIYGSNSINDSQFFVISRTAMPQLVEALRYALNTLDFYADRAFYKKVFDENGTAVGCTVDEGANARSALKRIAGILEVKG